MRALRTLSLCLACAVVLLGGRSAQATLYLQEGFNYQPGLLGTYPPWTGANTLIQVVGGSLGFRGLADFSPVGNAVSASAGGSAQSFTYRPFDTVATGKLYWSFVLRYARVEANVTFAGLLPSGVTLPGGPTVDPCDVIVKSATGGYLLGIRAKNGLTSYASANVLALGTAYLVVVKFDCATGVASLYLQARPGEGEPASAQAASDGDSVLNLRYLYLRVLNATAGDYAIDTVRVGPTWEEVTPWAPPPPAIRLALLSAPRAGTAGAILSNTVVQLQDVYSNGVPSNNVPITLSLDHGDFAGGTAILNTDAGGTARFNDLLLNTLGSYTLTAAASGTGAGLPPAISSAFSIGSPNPVSPQGQALSAFLDSLEVERYWANGVAVNWLTGATGDSGPNITRGKASHCSAFAAAVANVLGVYLLCQSATQSDMGLANAQADWLRTNPQAGWYAIADFTNAQRLANLGTLVVASLKETNDASGHIAVLRPSTKSDAELFVDGPQECQSGLDNFNSIDVKTGFRHHDDAFPNRIFYYGHPVTQPFSPVCPSLGATTCSNGVFRVTVTSIVGRTYRLQQTANLLNWSDVLTYTNSNEASGFWCQTSLSDPSAGGAPARLYRLLAR